MHSGKGARAGHGVASGGARLSQPQQLRHDKGGEQLGAAGRFCTLLRLRTAALQGIGTRVTRLSGFIQVSPGESKSRSRSKIKVSQALASLGKKAWAVAQVARLSSSREQPLAAATVSEISFT